MILDDGIDWDAAIEQERLDALADTLAARDRHDQDQAADLGAYDDLIVVDVEPLVSIWATDDNHFHLPHMACHPTDRQVPLSVARSEGRKACGDCPWRNAEWVEVQS